MGFFWRGGLWVLQGFLRRVGVLAWLFDGEFVVDVWLALVPGCHFFGREKRDSVFGFIFGLSRFGNFEC